MVGAKATAGAFINIEHRVATTHTDRLNVARTADSAGITEDALGEQAGVVVDTGYADRADG